MENSNKQNNTIEDSFGNIWTKCDLGNKCGLEIVRPGKCQCWCHNIEYLYNWHNLERQGWSGDGWYFWNWTKTICYGPYASYDKAKEQFFKYLNL